MNQINYMGLWGYNITLKVAPIALGGIFLGKLALTTPLFPCDDPTLPHLVYIFIINKYKNKFKLRYNFYYYHNKFNILISKLIFL